jgi:transposase
MAVYPAMVRKRIIELYNEHFKTKQIAEIFGVSRSGTRRVKQRLRERGTLEPLPHRRGRKPKMTPELQQQIRDHIAQHPDATREEIKTALDLSVSLQSISKWLKKLGLVLKKSRSTRPSSNARMLRRDAMSGMRS